MGCSTGGCGHVEEEYEIRNDEGFVYKVHRGLYPDAAPSTTQTAAGPDPKAAGEAARSKAGVLAAKARSAVAEGGSSFCDLRRLVNDLIEARTAAGSCLASWASKRYKNGGPCAELVDAEIQDLANLDDMVAVFELGVICTGIFSASPILWKFISTGTRENSDILNVMNPQIGGTDFWTNRRVRCLIPKQEKQEISRRQPRRNAIGRHRSIRPSSASASLSWQQ